MWLNWHISRADIHFIAMKIIAYGHTNQSRVQLAVSRKQALVHLAAFEA